MFEFTKDHLRIDPDMEIDCDIGCIVTAYVETWFDVDEKFGTQTADDDDDWVNFYAHYNTQNDELTTEYCVSKPDSCEYFDYIPTDTEKKLIIEMMENCCNKHYQCSLKEFVQDLDESDEIKLE